MPRAKVYKNLDESDFKITIDGFTFVFSSKFYMDKFHTKAAQIKEKLEIELESRYKHPVNLTLYAYFIAYDEIEKRGYLIFDSKGGRLEWQKHITLDGVIKIMRP